MYCEPTRAGRCESEFLKQDRTHKQHFEGKQIMRELGARPSVNDFFLGMAGTGAQWHINDIAVDVLGYGRKGSVSDNRVTCPDCIARL